MCLCSDTKIQAGLASEKRRLHWKDLRSEMVAGEGAVLVCVIGHVYLLR